MIQHASEAGDESSGIWLPLIEYSVRTGLSLSTIRRKIKSNSLPFRLEKGKYLILLKESNERPEVRVVRSDASGRQTVDSRPSAPAQQGGASDSAIKMVSEAFEHALREKEERIQLLEKSNRQYEQQINELRLLIKVLEEKYEVRY